MGGCDNPSCKRRFPGAAESEIPGILKPANGKGAASSKGAALMQRDGLGPDGNDLM
jgi:hypothetical protein